MKNKIKQNNTDVKNFLTGMKNKIKQNNTDVKNILTETCPVVNYEKTIVSSQCHNLKQDNIELGNTNRLKNFTTGMKKTILTSIIVFIGLLSLNQVAYAASAVLSVFPATASSTASSAFDVSVQINPTGNNVCVIKGTINFNNLTCQSITLANGLMAQTVPTCAAPNFTIGIPKCSAITQNLFSISVKGSAAGQAALSFSGVKVIGAGVDVASNLLPGTYNITAVPVKVPAKVVSTSTAPETLIPVESTETGLQVPRGVGELNPIKDIGENSSTTATSSISASSTATSTEEKKNGFVATALESLVNIPNKPMMALMLIALIAMGGLIFYNKKNNIDTPNISNTK